MHRLSELHSAQIQDSVAAANIDLWLNGHYDEITKKAIRKLIQENPKEAEDSFYSNLAFGTSGMRGLMGIGSNRLNNYTVRSAVQGLANYINKQPSSTETTVCIGFDSRHNSHAFAHEAAKVLAANGIGVLLFKDLRPTPLVSFGCLYKNCTAGIMFTASHNPGEYNGIKIFWRDGSQVSAPHDNAIMQEIKKIIDPGMVKTASSIDDPLIRIVSEEIDVPYIYEGSKLQFYPKDNEKHGKELNIVYTSFHGTGITTVPKVLAAWGFSCISFVDDQIIPNGNFPTAKLPDPENKTSLELGIKKLKDNGADILIANDPDADRVGIVVNHYGEPTILNGNQIASLCLEHICKALVHSDRMPGNAAFVKTIVTTELFSSICNQYKKPCYDVPTGFKNIARIIRQWEEDPHGRQFIFGAEESYGYLLGTLTRDKDAVIASALICEIALQAKLRSKTLIDLLHDLYRKYGVFFESMISVRFDETKVGKDKIKQVMADLRRNVPSHVNGKKLIAVEDYLHSIKKDLKTNDSKMIQFPPTDMLVFWLADGSKLTIRPSGTEPKIKLHCGVFDPNTKGRIEDIISQSQERATQLLSSFKNYITT